MKFQFDLVHLKIFKEMSYLFLIFIFSAVNVELYQLKRAENVWCLRFRYTDAMTQVVYTLEVDSRPFVFLPGNNIEMYFVNEKKCGT